jgi:hypothetical protein
VSALCQGQRVADRYVLDRRLGAGGFGEVWSADDDGEAVALKFLHPHLRATPDAPIRFRREILTTARLSHPAVVPVLDAGQTPGGHLWFAMEFVEGEPIDAVWSDDLFTTLHWFDRLLEVLAHAHARGVTHRDLKPDNVLVDAMGELRLLDFGVAAVDGALAGAVGADPSITNPGMPLGTAAYMSPEQSSGAPATCGPPSDLYSVGVMLFEFLTGNVPFTGTWIEVMAGHSLSPPPELKPREGMVLALPSGLATWVRRLLAKRYEDRPENAAMARTELAAICARIGVTTGGSTALQRQDERDTTLVAARTPRASATGSDGAGSAAGPAGALDIAQAREMPPLGRGGDLTALRRATSRPGVTVIAGDPGVGRRHLVRHLIYDLLERGASRVLRVHIGNAGTEAAVHSALVRALRPRRLERKWLLPGLVDGWQMPPELAADLCLFLSRGPSHTGTLPALAAGRLASTWHRTFLTLAAQPSPAHLLVWIDGEDTSGHLLECAALLSETSPVIWTHGGDRAQRLAQTPTAFLGPASGAPDSPRSFPSAETGAAETALRLTPIGDDDVRDIVYSLVPDAQGEVVGALVERAQGLPSLARSQTLDWLQTGMLADRDTARRKVETFGPSAPLDALALLRGPFPQQLVSAAFGGDVAVMFRALHAGLLEADPDGDGALRFTDARVATLLEERATTATAELAMELVEHTALEALLAGDWPVGEACLALAWSALPKTQRPTMLRLGCALAHRRRDAEVLAHRASQWSEHDASERTLWLALAQGLGEPGRALEAIQGIPPGTGEFEVRRGLAAAQCAGLAGQHDVAATRAHLAVGLAIELPNTRWNRLLRADVFSVLAETLVHAGQTGAAKTQLGLLLAEFEALGDAQGQAQVHLRLARIARRQGGDPEVSLARARRLLLRLDDRRSLAIAEWEAGAAALAADRLDDAEARFHAAADLFASVGDPTGAATCGNARGEVARKAGRLGDARGHYQAFATAMDDAGHTDGSAWARINLGWTELADDRPTAARRLFDEGRAHPGASPGAQTAGRLGAAVCALRAGDLTQARDLRGEVTESDDPDAAAALAELQTALRD